MDNRNTLLLWGAAGVGAWLVYRSYRKRQAYDFRHKSVLITGGTRGLGLVMARQLAQEGARLTVCARDREEAARAREDLARAGSPILAVRCDVREPDQVADLMQIVRSHYGRIDVLINNAGTISVGPLESMTRDDFFEAMATNFWAAVNTTLAVLPEMRFRGSGRIVNISSIGGKVSVPHLLPYSASKFALTGFSEGLRSEVAKDGVVVTTICPGLMRTGSPRNATFKGQHREEYAWFAISDSLPGLTVSAEAAASRIIDACRNGEAEVVVGFPAKCAALFHGVFPGLTADLLSYVNRLLPGPGGIGTRKARGAQSESKLAPSFLTRLTDQAAQRNNELLDRPAPAPAATAAAREPQRS